MEILWQLIIWGTMAILAYQNYNYRIREAEMNRITALMNLNRGLLGISEIKQND